jgi:hypothetical protein
MLDRLYKNTSGQHTLWPSECRATLSRAPRPPPHGSPFRFCPMAGRPCWGGSACAPPLLFLGALPCSGLGPNMLSSSILVDEAGLPEGCQDDEASGKPGSSSCVAEEYRGSPCSTHPFVSQSSWTRSLDPWVMHLCIMQELDMCSQSIAAISMLYILRNMPRLRA